jgi:hypothetical protein
MRRKFEVEVRAQVRADARSPIEKLIDEASLRCTICGGARCACWEPCSCGWSRERGKPCDNPAHVTPEKIARRRRALAYVGRVAAQCGCSLPGGEGEACGCKPGCDCHMSEEEAASACDASGGP